MPNVLSKPEKRSAADEAGPSSKRQKQSKTFAFTINDESSKKTFQEYFDQLGDAELEDIGVQYYQVQEERGENSDHTHYQGIIQMMKVMRWPAVKNWFDAKNIHLYVEPAIASKSLDDYCKKSETKVEGGYHSNMGTLKQGNRIVAGEDRGNKAGDVYTYLKEGGDPRLVCKNLGASYASVCIREILDKIRMEEDYYREQERKLEAEDFFNRESMPPKLNAMKWQLEIKECLDELIQSKDDRTIVCVLDKAGNAGKSTLAKMLAYLNPAERPYLTNGKTNDLSYILAPYKDLELLLVDFSRDDAKYQRLDIYERLKNGYIQSTKYQSMMRDLGHAVQILIMTNNELFWHRVTEDRWKICELKKVDETTTKRNDDGTTSDITVHKIKTRWWNEGEVYGAASQSRHLEETLKLKKKLDD